MVIETKFNIGDELFYVYSMSQKKPSKVRIAGIKFDSSKQYKIKYDSDSSLEAFQLGYDIKFDMKEENLFQTEAEAYERLKELQESKKWVGI